MPLGTEVGLGPGDTVLDGTRGTAAPCRSRPHCIEWGPSSLPRKRNSSPPTFPMSTVAKRSPISAAAELVEICERTDRQTDIQAHLLQYFALSLNRSNHHSDRSVPIWGRLDRLSRRKRLTRIHEKLETVSIAQPLQNRQNAQNP